MNIIKIGILTHFLIFATLFAFIVPVFESPDEPHHLAYINFVARESELPNQYEKGKFVFGEGHQHPLYYMVTAIFNHIFNLDKTVNITPIANKKHILNGGISRHVPLYRHISHNIFESKNDRYNFYFLRMFSIFLSILNLAYIFKLSQMFFKHSKWNLFPAIFVATIPQFLFISGMINNDNLANLFTTISIYYSLSIIESPEKKNHFILLGIFLGLGILAKKTVLFLIPAIFIILCYVSLKKRHMMQKIGKYTLLMSIVVLIISGWLFIRNYCLYGELLGTQMEKSTLPIIIAEKSLFSKYFIEIFPKGLFISFIGNFGWLNVSLPAGIYFFYIFLILVSIIGLFLYLREKKFCDTRTLFSLLIVCLCFAEIVYYNLSYSQYQGRFLFPTVSLIAILLTLGFKSVCLRIDSEHLKKIISHSIIYALLLIDLVSVLWVHQFYYRVEQYLW